MKSKFTKNNDDRYTIVYFDNMKDLQIDFTEYLVLQTLVYFSKRNTYQKGISKIITHLELYRNTIYKSLKTLIMKEHITKDGKTYNLNYDLKERFETSAGVYVQIYHKHRKLLNISVVQYVFLYMIYSLSKNKLNKVAIAGTEYYRKHTNISTRHFYTSINNLTEKNILEPQNNSHLKLNENIFNWFESKCSKKAE